ncbi:MAG: cadmium-translocating P-type ATPase [Clostridiales bacterium]|nr:cadmium-translocating P-type ATPase [Clostridiales bacterium]
MTTEQKTNLIRVIVSIALVAAIWLSPAEGWLGGALYLLPYLLVGYDVLWEAVEGVFHGEVFDENFLMAVATVGAIALGDWREGCAVMVFYQVGELFQSCAVDKSRRSISDLMDIRPDHANIEKDGALAQVDPGDVEIGTIIVVQPGERIPIDGVVTEGESAVNTGALTGESLPRQVRSGDEVLSGCVNESGLLHIRTTKKFGDSTVARILDLVENSGKKKSEAENFITRFARVYTPAVCCCALALALLPPLFMWDASVIGEWITRALTFLVISCPCALVISIPLSFFGGIGGASARGILVKGGNYLEALARMDCVVFDKTGTLTKGVFQVIRTQPEGMDEQTLLSWAARAECYSGHPISQSLKAAWGGEVQNGQVTDAEELGGYGLTARVDGHAVAVGNKRLMEKLGLNPAEPQQAGTVVFVAVDGVYAGWILLGDVVKDRAREAIRGLKAEGISKTVMLTGDTDAAARQVASQLGVDEVHSQLLPADKVQQVERLLQERKDGRLLAFVGDGINDAPVLARADIGIAMGALGSDAAIEAADVVLMDDDPAKIALAMRISRRTLRIVRENIVFALAVKAACLVLGAVGVANMWLAISADVGVMVLAVLNAARALRAGKE